MVYVDQAQLNAQMEAFSRSVDYKGRFLGVASGKLLKVEANRLTQTLIRLTPPQVQASAKKKIKSDVERKMGTLEGHDYAFADQFNPQPVSKQGTGDVRWFLWTSSVIFGAAREKDMRAASDDEIYKTYWNTVLGKSTGLINPGGRGKQKIRIIQRHQFTKASIRRLIARLQEHVGRLKAGWAVAWKATGAGTGIYNPPNWVLKHLTRGTPRGRVVDLTHDESFPSIAIANNAKGATSENVRTIAHHALKVRLDAIPNRLVQIIKHPELLQQEVA